MTLWSPVKGLPLRFPNASRSKFDRTRRGSTLAEGVAAAIDDTEGVTAAIDDTEGVTAAIDDTEGVTAAIDDTELVAPMLARDLGKCWCGRLPTEWRGSAASAACG